MGFDGAGRFTIDTAGTPVQYDTVIDHAMFNNVLAEIETGFTNTVCKDGQTLVTQNLTMNGFRLNDVGDPTSRLDAVNADTLIQNTLLYDPAPGGTANAITVALPIAVQAYTLGMRLSFLSIATNTAAVTIEVNDLGVVGIVRPSGQALQAGDIPNDQIIDIIYDGVNFRMMRQSYAEGNWTLSVGGSATYTAQIGRWTRMGRIVHIVGFLSINTIGTGSTSIISGLPYTSANIGVDQALHVGDFSSLATSVVWIGARVNTNSTTITLRNLTAAGASATSSALLGNGSIVSISGSYIL